jgi:hypothetical protein
MAASINSNSNFDKKRKNFRWNPEMIEQLIDSMMEYKTQMSYKGIDFDGDKPMQHKELRLMMAEINKEDTSLFGPVYIDQLPDSFDEMPKEEKDLAKERVKVSKELVAKGTKRVMEKVKEIRQSFSKAVISGKRSGSGKIVFEFYDKLILLWGGSANVSPLTYGVGSDSFEQESDFEQDEQDIFNEQDVNDFSNATTLSLELNVSPLPVEDDNTEETEAVSATSANKRRASCVPQLIDNKRKHLEKNLSAAQRDKMLFEEAKDDAKFRKELTESLKDSSATFAQGIQDVSKAILDMGAGLSRSIEMLSHGFSRGLPPHPVNQNMFYQYPVQYMPSHASNPSVYIPMSNETPRKVMQQDNGSDENMQD